ncbi:MAG: metallophosphoesterase [Actinobacteria bacterium]|nr:metallophosphoesterase [Actinomycetota bacterium]
MRRGRGVVRGAAAAAAAGLAWTLWESQWVEGVEVDVPIRRLPQELDGFRILHLSDLHLGTISLNALALDRALEWARERSPDLVVVTGDLVSRRAGKWKLEQALGRLRAPHGTWAILGNHDVDDARDPFSRPTDLSDLHERGATLLRDRATTLEVNGRSVEIVGLDPETHGRGGRAPVPDPRADLRILLAHFPDAVDRLPPRSFDLALAGHLHGGQICLPSPWGKVRLSHVRGGYWEGLFETAAGMLYVSRGLGTTFVPFRLFARPEVAMLTLRASH